jgi:hypothetical protein
MRIGKALIVAAAALTLPSCAVYVHDYPTRHPAFAPGYAGPPGGGRIGVIGLSLGRGGESHRGPIVVERVIPGGPAAEADIRSGDRIRAIDGESTRGMTVAEAAHLIRGPADTSVALRIDSPHGSRLITLVRVPSSRLWGRDRHWRGHPCMCRPRMRGGPCAECPHRRGHHPCADCPRMRGHRPPECPYAAERRPCDRGGRACEMAAPVPEPPPAAESTAPEEWPPTKPGHTAR